MHASVYEMHQGAVTFKLTPAENISSSDPVVDQEGPQRQVGISSCTSPIKASAGGQVLAKFQPLIDLQQSPLR